MKTRMQQLFVVWVWSLLAWLVVASGSAWAQNSNIVEASDSLTGFWIKKVVSDTLIPSGVTFSYTIYFSFPVGTQNVTITDQLPSTVVFHSLTVNNACPPTSTSLPLPGTTGTVQVSWGALPNGCSGSMTIVVSFPNGITCNGAEARNAVCLVGSVNVNGNSITSELCTKSVNTIAQAVSTWSIDKSILNTNHIGGNCPHAFYGDTVTYFVCILNSPSLWGWNGQLNLVNSTLTDILPSGAQFVSASCPNVSVSGQTITWNLGNLSATQYYSQCCTLKVYYPSAQFPANSQITNTVTLSGQTGSAQNSCGPIQVSDTECGTKLLPTNGQVDAQLAKSITTNGQPGCAGSYGIGICNTGNSPINSATIKDTLPTGVTFTGFDYTHPGLTVSQSSGIITATLNGALQPGECRAFWCNFIVSPSATPNSTITNCAWAEIPGLQPLQACGSFTVQAPAPIACIGKQICSPQASYTPGQIVRLRFRLQNIGGQDISGATITDNLHPSLQYVGNPTFYMSSPNWWNPSCNPTIPGNGFSAWSPAPTISSIGQTITISNITIPATCHSFFANGCGNLGNTAVDYYWIEFDVKIADTAALGNIPNNYTISGGGLPEPVTSNTVYFLVTGTAGFTLQKSVAADTTNWQQSLTASAGSTVNYRLQMNWTGNVQLRHATFVDLLPLDNGSSDGKILETCLPRGSQYNVTYQSTLLSTPASTGYNNPATTLANANAISTTIGAPSLFPTSCGTAGSWSSGIPSGTKNLAFVFGTINPGVSPTVVFAAKIDQQAQPGTIACNTFAAGGAVRHLLNSSTIQDVPVGELESDPVCITIDSTQRCYTVQSRGTPSPIGIVSTSNGNACKYQWTVTISNPGPATQGCVTSPQGQVTPSSFAVPTGNSTQTLTFIDIPPKDQVACFYFGTLDASGVCKPCDTICVDLPPCPQSDTCCPRAEKLEIKCKGRDSTGNLIYQICATGTLRCKATLVLSSPDGSFAPSAFSVGPGAFTICTDFTDLPPSATGVITVNYTVLGQGAVLCRDSAQIQLPPCPVQPRNCCDLWQRSIQTLAVQSFSNGTVIIKGLATASTPISGFKAAIVSAQRKKWCPITPQPINNWQRIHGDITSGWLSPAPGAGVQLTPFSRQISWEGPVPDSCMTWTQNSPASFLLTMNFPPVTGYKCGDTLRFTVRYTFTDCKCQSCDTLITYEIVRRYRFQIFPWFNLTVQRTAQDAFDIYIPGLAVQSDDKSSIATLKMLELQGIELKDIRLINDKKEQINDIQIITVKRGSVVVIPNGSSIGYTIHAIAQEAMPNSGKQINAIWTWDETDTTGVSQSISEERELMIPAYSKGHTTSTGTLIQDRESMPPHVRTFSLAFINGPVSADEVEVELRALPQPDGTVPQIIAAGSDEHSSTRAKLGPPYVTLLKRTAAVEPGAIWRPIYITVTGSKRELLDAVEIEYVIRDANNSEIGRGRLLLQGALSGIEQDEDTPVMVSSAKIGSVIPNPSDYTVTVALHAQSPQQYATLEIVDALGRPVATVLEKVVLQAGTTAVSVDVSKLPNGTYLLVLRTSSGVSTAPLRIVR